MLDSSCFGEPLSPGKWNVVDNFRKLLTRNTFAGTKPVDTTGSRALTKPDILNLLSSDVAQVAEFVWTTGSVIQLFLSAAVGCVFIWYLLGK